MSHYNPKIYNFSNLENKDKNIILAMLWSLETLEALEFDYKDDGKSTTLEKIRSEIARDVLAEAEERIVSDAVQVMVSMIDRYDQDVDEIDTTDYLYGLEEYSLSYDDDEEKYIRIISKEKRRKKNENINTCSNGACDVQTRNALRTRSFASRTLSEDQKSV